MKFILRSPKLPVLIDGEDQIYCMTGDPDIDIDLTKVKMAKGSMLHAIDSSGESFSYSPEHDTISPLAIKQKNTKSALVELYNSKRIAGSPEYSVKSLSNTKYSKIFSDLATRVQEESALEK